MMLTFVAEKIHSVIKYMVLSFDIVFNVHIFIY